MFEWLIAKRIDENNDLKKQGNQLTAREQSKLLKVRKENLNDAYSAKLIEANKVQSSANALAYRTFVMRILAEAPHSKKVVEYYKKVWKRINDEHTALIAKAKALYDEADRLDKEYTLAHKEWYDFKGRYDLWGDNYC